MTRRSLFLRAIRALLNVEALINWVFAGELYTVEHGLSVSFHAILTLKDANAIFISPMVASETAQQRPLVTASALSFRRPHPASTYHVPSTLTLSPMSSTKFGVAHTGASSTRRP